MGSTGALAARKGAHHNKKGSRYVGGDVYSRGSASICSTESILAWDDTAPKKKPCKKKTRKNSKKNERASGGERGSCNNAAFRDDAEDIVRKSAELNTFTGKVAVKNRAGEIEGYKKKRSIELDSEGRIIKKTSVGRRSTGGSTGDTNEANQHFAYVGFDSSDAHKKDKDRADRGSPKARSVKSRSLSQTSKNWRHSHASHNKRSV